MTQMTKLIIERFRQFDKPVEIPLDPITVLIGANNSGKTAVLQALALFQYCLEKCLTRNGRNGVNGPWSLKKTENVRPDEFGPLPVATPTDLWPQGRARGAIRLSAEFASGGTITFEIKLQYNLFTIRPTASGFAHLNALLERLAIRLIPVFSGLLPREEFLVLPARQERQQAQRYGEIVRNLLFSLKKDAPARFQLLQQLLARLYPEATVDVTYDEEVARRIASARIDSAYHDEILMHDLDLIVAGSGLHQAVQIFAGMLQPGVSVVLLDEPDAHFHARLQGELMRILIELTEQEDLQFVIATHSPPLLRTAPPDSLRVCRQGAVARFNPGPDHLELLDHLGALDRMELVPLIASRRVVFVENREDRQIIEGFTRKQLGSQAARVLQRLTFLYTYQEPVSAGVLDKARQVNDILKDASLAALGAGGSVAFVSVGDRDYRTEGELKAQEKSLATKAREHGFGFPFRLLLWRRTEIENYLIDPDALCAAAAAEAARRAKAPAWHTLEPEFRAFVREQIAAQKNNLIERLAARLQDRDRRQNLTTVMDKARQMLDAEWGDGTAWCDAKKVLSAARQFLQQHGIPAQTLSHQNIIDVMPQVPDDVAKLVKAIKTLAKPVAGTGGSFSRKGRRPK
jgi:predicted ATPase